MGENEPVVRVDTVPLQEVQMDLAMFLAIGVATLIAFSGYLLFNDVPSFGRGSSSRRSSRRS